jgi:hypothetical protein
MTWITTLAVGGMVLAAGPILIHILFRWRYRVVRFAAFRFLMESRRRHRRRIRLEELFLLLLRVLACVLVGLMLADVRSLEGMGAVGRTVPTVHLFVLDDSLSMGQLAGTVTLYEKAVGFVRRRLEALPEADAAAVISASLPRSARAAGWGRLLPAAEVKRPDFLARLSGSRPTGLRADWPAALRTVPELMATAERMPARLHVLSDFRRPDFTGAESVGALRAAFAALEPTAVDVSLLDFGLPCRNNLAVERLTAGRNVIVAGVSTPVRALVRNTGEGSAAATRLEVAVGETKLPVQPVPALAPGEAAQVDFACTFEAAGGAACSVSLPPDDLPGDNTCSVAFEAREALSILVLDGSANPAEPESASYALASCLDPSGKGTFGRRVDVRAAATWNPATLPAYDVVFMTNVREFPVTKGPAGDPVCPTAR